MDSLYTRFQPAKLRSFVVMLLLLVSISGGSSIAMAQAIPGASNPAQIETGAYAPNSLTVQAAQNLNLDPYGRIVDVAFSQNLDLTAPWDRFRFDIDIVRPLASNGGAFLGDLNDDGVLDLMLADGNGHRLFFPGKAGSPRSFGDGIMLKETQPDISLNPYGRANGFWWWLGGDIGDIDNDGDNEIVIGQEIYKNVGTPAEPKLDYQYSFSGVGNWDPATSLGDLNGDGKLDAVVSTNYANGGNFICWNNSTPGAISFSSCTKLSITSTETKTVGDLNGDGLLDLADEGGIYFNQGTTLNPVFPGTPAAWNVLGGPNWSGAGDMSMNISLRDANGDGLLDSYLSKVGDTAWQALYYENIGTVAAPQFQYIGPVVVSSTPMSMARRMYTDSGTLGLTGDAHVATADIDSNGSPDILLSPIWDGQYDTSSYSSILWGFPSLAGNTDTYAYQDLYTYPFMPRIDQYFQCGVGTWDPKDFLCKPPTIFGAWTDLNNDGLSDAIRIGIDYDASMSMYYGLYSNIRVGTWPFTLAAETPFQSVPSGNQGRGMAIAVTDVNLDGRPDLVIGQEDGTLLYYRNTTSGFADPIPLSDSLGSPIDVGDQASPTAIDLNGDGNLDFLVADYDGTIHKVLNVTPGSPQGYTLGGLLGTAEQNPVDIVDVVGGGWLSPTLGTIDIDKDGLLDVLMGDLDGQVWLLHNIGDQNSASFSLTTLNIAHTTAAYMEKLDASHYRLYFALPTEANQTKLEFHLPLSSGEVTISAPLPLPGAFNKTSPSNGATNQSTSPTLNWGTSVGATSYEYCYDTTNDNACSNWISNGTSASKALSGLSEGTTYYWHVRANNAGGTTYANGSSTAFWSFTTATNPPGAFNKSAPTNGATNQSASPTLSWGTSTGATSYEYCYDTTDDNACSNWTSNGTATSKTLSGLGGGTTYYWQVRANSSGGTTYANGGATAFWAFATAQVSSFSDVSTSYWAWQYIERLYGAGITGGCSTSPLNYCPESQVTRAQMAVFLEKGIAFPASFTPPDVAPTFIDTIGHWAEDWIEVLKSDGITSGCGTGLYCPENPVTRAQMAVFLLKAKYGSSYMPPAATGIFTDVPIGYWADKWIEQLAAEGITSGCAAGLYCPDSPVTRAQMAVFLVKAFNLP